MADLDEKRTELVTLLTLLTMEKIRLISGLKGVRQVKMGGLKTVLELIRENAFWRLEN